MLWFVLLVACGARGCLHQTNCGFPGITEGECRSKRCCFDPTTNPPCSAPSCNSSVVTACQNRGTCRDNVCECRPGWTGWDCSETKITTVHVVQSCHLDVGFKNSSVNIINEYFDHHFPMIIDVAEELRKAKGAAQLKFTAQSYVVSLYLSCPIGMGLHCPTASDKARFESAVRNGSITWHAFPFNAELELYTPAVLSEGIALSHRLDEQFNLSLKTTLSQRDVPGTTRAIIPLLKRSGVTAISVGVNVASTPPAVPKVFIWKDTISGEESLAMWHPYGYGSYLTKWAVIVPGSTHALVTDWNGDNRGPFDAKTYQSHFTAIQREFPGAKVIASTFDAFTSEVLPFKKNLPVVTEEVGDSWIYGCPSDPKKLAMLRALDRTWSAYLAGGGVRDSVYLNATRLMLKNGEHTWGKDQLRVVKDNTSWSNAAFIEARAGPEKSQFGGMEESWWEQRRWGIEIPIETLDAAGHPLGKRARAALVELNPSVPDLSRFTKVEHVGSRVFICGPYSVSFDAVTGAVSGLNHTTKGSWADRSHPLGLFEYHTYSPADFQSFFKGYLGPHPENWAMRDFGKPGNNISKHLKVSSKLEELWMETNHTSTSFAIKLEMADPTVVTDYGAPAQIWMEWYLDHQSTVISLRANVFNKTSTRLPEAMFLRFQPSPGGVQWEMSKLGSWMPIGPVVHGGSPHHHGVDEGLRYRPSSSRSMEIQSTDAGIFCLGEPLGFPTPVDIPPDTLNQGVAAMLWNTLWGTNYVVWIPYHKDYQPVEGEGDFLFRFNLSVQ